MSSHALVSLACLALLLPAVFGCSCIRNPSSVRDSFCSTSNTVVFKVIGARSPASGNAMQVSYPIVMITAYKWESNVNQISRVYTAESSAACGTNLQEGQVYIYHGSINPQHFTIGLCSNYRPFSQLTNSDLQFLIQPNTPRKCLRPITISPITIGPIRTPKPITIRPISPKPIEHTIGPIRAEAQLI
jgi:hypothetical protein